MVEKSEETSAFSGAPEEQQKDTSRISSGVTLSQRELTLSQREFMKPLPFWKKVLFSMGFYSNGINVGIIGLFQQLFLLEVVELPPRQVGNMMLVKQLYDAITDPIVGTISDNTNTRFGRRKPYIVTFMIPLAIVWVLMWTYNGDVLNEHWEVPLYYFGIILLYSTLQTLTLIPYQAMVPDISPSYNDRTTVVMLGQFVGLIASTTSIFIWSTLIVSFPDPSPETDGTKYDYKKGYLIAAVVTSIPILITMLIAIIPVKERVNLRIKEDKAKQNCVVGTFNAFKGMFVGMKDLITFLPFIWVVVINITGGLSQALVFNNINLWIKYWILEEKRTNLILTTAQIGLMIGVVFFSLWAKRITKKWSLIWGSALGFIAFSLLFFIQAHQLLIVFVVIFIEGFAAGANFALPPAMLPDVIEMDERRTGKRREALFYSFFFLIEKMAIAFTQAGSSYTLELTGYIPPTEQAAENETLVQPDSVLLALRILVCVVPALLKIVVVPFALSFPYICKRYGFSEQGQEIQIVKETSPILHTKPLEEQENNQSVGVDNNNNNI